MHKVSPRQKKELNAVRKEWLKFLEHRLPEFFGKAQVEYLKALKQKHERTQPDRHRPPLDEPAMHPAVQEGGSTSSGTIPSVQGTGPTPPVQDTGPSTTSGHRVTLHIEDRFRLEKLEKRGVNLWKRNVHLRKGRVHL